MTKVESVLFSGEGSKGLLERLDEFMTEFWAYVNIRRKESCFYLNDRERVELVETTKKEKKKMGWQGVALVLSSFSTIAATATLVLKLLGLL